MGWRLLLLVGSVLVRSDEAVSSAPFKGRGGEHTVWVTGEERIGWKNVRRARAVRMSLVGKRLLVIFGEVEGG